MQPTPDGLDEGQRAALRRLQRAQLAMVRALGATLDATYEAEGRPHQRAA